MNPLLSLNHRSHILIKISPQLGIRGGALMPRFGVTSGRLSLFLAALISGIVVPARVSFAQG
jgi:hypothetical protein